MKNYELYYDFNFISIGIRREDIYTDFHYFINIIINKIKDTYNIPYNKIDMYMTEKLKDSLYNILPFAYFETFKDSKVLIHEYSNYMLLYFPIDIEIKITIMNFLAPTGHQQTIRNSVNNLLYTIRKEVENEKH